MHFWSCLSTFEANIYISKLVPYQLQINGQAFPMSTFHYDFQKAYITIHICIALLVK